MNDQHSPPRSILDLAAALSALEAKEEDMVCPTCDADLTCPDAMSTIPVSSRDHSVVCVRCGHILGP